ncbi:hypothetical protein GP486_004277 [Trichoglossum hirsutum]|uniref:Uncharacterized protein n=1 Tax=Trichoglossum hirsutum TaxID=265104 RepID=A0A9P8RPC4_9PEZI|nr:hypothetical protein GP486_004277 [Trichoglossum hirsutum]
MPAEEIPQSSPSTLDGDSDEPFAWLRSLPAVKYPLDGPQGRNVAARIDALTAEAKVLGLEVPPEFKIFMTDADLYGKVPTSACCYLDLPSRLVPLPDVNGIPVPGRLLRFLNDQQYASLWYLHLLPGKQYEVVVASPIWSEVEEHDVPLEDKIATFDWISNCADSLEEFVWEFWSENRLWFNRQGWELDESESETDVDTVQEGEERTE